MKRVVRCGVRGGAAGRGVGRGWGGDSRQDAEGRHGHGCRRAERPRLQPPRLRRAPAGEEASWATQIRVAESRRRRLHPQPRRVRASGLRPRGRGRLHRDRCDGRSRQALPEHALRDRRRRERRSRRQAEERPRDALPRGAGGLPGRLPRRARDEAPARRRRRQLGCGREAAAGRPLHRRLPGGREEGEPERQGAERLLAGLQRPGEVQGDRAEPDRRRVARGVRGCRRLRPRRARCRPHREGVGDRRRRRPVVPRPAHPHQRDEEGRPRRVPRDHVRAAGPLPRRGRDLRAEGGRRRPRQDQRQGARLRGRQGQADPGAADRGNDRPAEDPRSPCGAGLGDQPHPTRLVPVGEGGERTRPRRSRPRGAPRRCARRAPGGGEAYSGRSPSTENAGPSVVTSPSRWRIPIASSCGSAATSPMSCTGAAGTPAAASFSSQAARRVLAEPHRERLGERFAVRDAVRVRREPRVVGELRGSDRLGQPPEEPVVRGGDHQAAVRGGKHLVRRDRVEAPFPARSERRRVSSVPIRW